MWALRRGASWETREVPNPDRVLLRKADDGSHHEVGDLLERIQGKRWTLMLPDGTKVEHVMEPNEVTVVRGSMNHRLRISPQGVEAELRKDPGRVFRQLLSESPRGAKASQLKDALHGMDRALVDKAWQRAKKELDAADDVRRSDSRVPVYSLVTPAAERQLPAAPVEESTTDSLETLEPSGEERSADADDAQDLTGTVDDMSPGERSDDPLVQLLSREGLVERHETLDSLARTPLALTLALRRLTATDLRDVVPALPTSHLTLCTVLLGPGKEGVLRAEVPKVTPKEYGEALRAGITELEGAGDSRSRLAPVLGALVERAANATVIALPVLVSVSRTLADAGTPGREGLDRSLEAVARHADVLQGVRDANLSRRLTQAARRA
jgi:hypothetical protein